LAKLDDRSFSKDFLIAEFNALQERAMSLEKIKSGRINLFLIIVAATVAASVTGLSSLAGNLKQIYPIIILAGSVTVFLLGVLTLNSIMGYSIAIAILFQKAERIRHWFVKNDKGIEKYIPFEVNDHRSPIKVAPWLISWRGEEPILLITNAAALSVATGLTISYFSLSWAVVSAVAVLLITWEIQVLYMSSHLKKQEITENRKSLYPTTEPQSKKKSSRKNAT
jgi:hypothetical protein